jgi:hypothetical protein
VNRKTITAYAAIMAVGLGGLSAIPSVDAAGFNPMNMMNPSKWMGGNKDRYYDDYDDYYGGPYGPPPGAGWGGPGWGGPYGGPGYGAPGWGGYRGPYGAPGYGAAPYGAAPGYAAPTKRESTPSNKELLERLEKLEAEQQRLAYPPPPPAPTRSKDTGSAYSPPESGGYTFPDTSYQSPQLWR